MQALQKVHSNISFEYQPSPYTILIQAMIEEGRSSHDCKQGLKNNCVLYLHGISYASHRELLISLQRT